MRYIVNVGGCGVVAMGMGSRASSSTVHGHLAAPADSVRSSLSLTVYVDREIGMQAYPNAEPYEAISESMPPLKP